MPGGAPLAERERSSIAAAMKVTSTQLSCLLVPVYTYPERDVLHHATPATGNISPVHPFITRFIEVKVHFWCASNRICRMFGVLASGRLVSCLALQRV